MTSRSSMEGTRRTPSLLRRQKQLLYWYGGNLNSSCCHRCLASGSQCLRPAGLCPGVRRGLAVVKVGSGSGECFLQPGSKNFRSSSCAVRAICLRHPTLSSIIAPSACLNSQSHQYNRGLLARETHWASICHGSQPKSFDITCSSCQSIEATDSMILRT